MISFNSFCLDSNDGKMNITAKVIDTLEIVHNEDIEFGNIFHLNSTNPYKIKVCKKIFFSFSIFSFDFF
ncbi:MAG: hypothetical protein ACRC5T_12835 [Cetobacterium sp.]